MIREIIRYPKTPSIEFGATVRYFDEELFTLLDDMKETIEFNNIQALAAFQVGSPLSAIVLKQEDGTFLEIINVRMIKREGTVHPVETTSYFPGLSATTTRYEKIKIMYEDREEQQHFLDADGELSILLQRKIDYLFGANFHVRLSKEEEVLFESKLEFGTDAITQNGCPTVFKRDKILKGIKILFVVGIVALITKFFLSTAMLGNLKTAENTLMLTMLFLSVVYFFYAQYEGKQYKHCSSCQIGNIIGTTVFSLTRVFVLFLVNYFLLW